MLYKPNKEHATRNDNSGKRSVYILCCFPELSFQVACSLFDFYQMLNMINILFYSVSVTYTKFLYMTIALKAFNEMQQTACIRINSMPYDIIVIYFTYFQMYYYLMQYYH